MELGRTYAGILGPMAFVTVIVRGLRASGGVEGTLWNAFVCLFVFAAVGYVVGELAATIVADSVRGQVARELDARLPSRPSSGEGRSAT